MGCVYCGGKLIKRGKKKERQCYRCKMCGKHWQDKYQKHRIAESIYKEIHSLMTKGLGICAMGEYFRVANSSIQRIIERLVKCIPEQKVTETGQSYELDELCTFCGNKKNRIWVIYALNCKTKQIVAFCVGGRTKKNLKKVVRSVLKLSPKHLYTDKLNTYQSLISKEIHRIYPKCTNHIERKNLTLRTRLKRLGRKALNFTRSARMLYNSIFLWVHGGDSFVIR